MKKNQFLKERKANNPYEIWGNSPILPNWTWYVLKKWQKNDNKEYARWFCLVKTPIVPEGEYGDVYVKDIKEDAIAIQICKGCNKNLSTIDNEKTLSKYEHGYICRNCGFKEIKEKDFIKPLLEKIIKQK